MKKLRKKIQRKIQNLSKKERVIILIVCIIAILLTAIIFNLTSNDNIKNGIWVKGYDMNNVNLDTLSKNGIENIFIHSSAVDKFGAKNVSEWVKKANDKDIKVHIWVQCFYNGTWVNPINTSSKEFNYPYFDKKIAEIKKLATIPGISGIQLDYIRYPGNAYNYNYSNDVTPSNAITKFVSMVSDNLDDNLTLSATVMPEKDDVKYYGQNVRDLSWHVDVVIPMAYSGNYNENSTWIKETATYFKNEAWWSNVCIGIQNYVSDTNQTPLSANQLKENSQSALDGGANGVSIFTWELMKNWFDFKTLKY